MNSQIYVELRNQKYNNIDGLKHEFQKKEDSIRTNEDTDVMFESRKRENVVEHFVIYQCRVSKN